VFAESSSCESDKNEVHFFGKKELRMLLMKGGHCGKQSRHEVCRGKVAADRCLRGLAGACEHFRVELLSVGSDRHLSSRIGLIVGVVSPIRSRRTFSMRILDTRFDTSQHLSQTDCFNIPFELGHP
jgi:hypothetical protein